MRRAIQFRREASREFDLAIKWYDSQRSGLGRRFLRRVNQTLDEISAHPERFAIVNEDTRVAIVSRFPYAIYFFASSDRIDVVSVFHSSRDPSIWQNRI